MTSSLLLLEEWRTLRAVPFPLRLGSQVDAAEVEPLDRTVRIVATDHHAVGDLLTDAVRRLVGVHGHVKHLLRHGQHQADGRVLGRLIQIFLSGFCLLCFLLAVDVVVAGVDAAVRGLPVLFARSLFGRRICRCGRTGI